MKVNFKIRGVEEVQSFIKSIPRGTVKAGLKAFTEYIIGNQAHGLKHYSPYKYITRKAAYGKTFESDAQRRYVMAAIRDGRIDPGVPHRTGKVQRGWYAQETNEGYGFRLKNDEPGAYFTMDDTGQAKQPALAGWRKVTQVIADNFAGAIRHANAEVKKWLEKK